MPAQCVRRAVLPLLAAAASTAALLAPSGPASAATCSDVDLVFARGTGELQGPSVLQTPMLAALKKGLPGRTVSSYSVVYPAGVGQDFDRGTADLIRHVARVGKACPRTTFVLGGYSQGASVVDGAVGVSLYPGLPAPASTMSAAARKRVAAIVTFGNPLGNQELAAAAPAYRSRIKEFCAAGDIVCDSYVTGPGHLSYATNGDPARAGAFAVARVKRAGPSTAAPTAKPAPKSAPRSAKQPDWPASLFSWAR